MPGADRTNRQRRCLPVEYSTREEGGELYIEGYFAVFNSPYEFWPGASEVILPGAFDESVSGDVRALVNHNSDLVLARTKSGTPEACGGVSPSTRKTGLRWTYMLASSAET